MTWTTINGRPTPARTEEGQASDIPSLPIPSPPSHAAIMATGDELRVLANTRLKEHFERNRENDYDKVHVLLLHWQKSDLSGFKAEAFALEKLFSERFQYRVLHWEIPPDNSQLLLDAKIANFLASLIEPRSLGIIHYGGHGDADEDSPIRERRSVWASHGDKDELHGSTLSWSKIQDKLGEVEADVFLILDCCFAAQTMRNRGRVVPPNVELLAACAMRLGTPGPATKQSFTMALIRELQLALDGSKPVVVKELYSLLARQDSRLLQTPIYHPQQSNKSIRLDPLTRGPRNMQRLGTSKIGTSLSLHIDVSAPVSDMFIDEILSWLMLNAPREVSHVQIVKLVDRTKRLQRFVSSDPSQRISQNSPISLSKVPQGPREEVMRAWTDFKDDVARSARNTMETWESTNEELDQSQLGDSASPVLEFFGRLKAVTSNLQSIITRSVLAIPELFDENVLRNEINVAAADEVGVSSGALEVRLAGCMAEVPDTKPLKHHVSAKTAVTTASRTLSRATISDLGDVLIEYKYINVSDFGVADASRERIMRLVTAMRKAANQFFRTPECLGYLADDLHGQYGIVFQGPHDPECRAVSLLWLLREHSEGRKGVNKPSLGQRYQLALTIGRALLQWHLAGWVHQGIASTNIMLFEDKPGTIAYASPYLLGFEYTREQDASSARREALDREADMYRHPDRQGTRPKKLHRKHHDMYSFGLMLVEIGLWCPLDKCIKQSWGTAGIRDGFLKSLGRGALSHGMGLAFEKLTLRCLSGDLVVDVDDRNETRLAAMFEDKVLRPLERSMQVDGGILPEIN